MAEQKNNYTGLIAKMQDAAANYIEPTAYVMKTKGGTCKADSRVELPSKHQAKDTIRNIQQRRDNMFIGDIIYFLDSEEHSTNLKIVPKPDGDEVVISKQSLTDLLFLAKDYTSRCSYSQEAYDKFAAAVAEAKEKLGVK